MHFFSSTWLSNPSMTNIAKNKIDQNGAPGIVFTAVGYATNAKPGPERETNVWNSTVINALDIIGHYSKQLLAQKHTWFGELSIVF